MLSNFKFINSSNLAISLQTQCYLPGPGPHCTQLWCMSLLSFNLEHSKSLLVSCALMVSRTLAQLFENSPIQACLAVFIRFGHFSLPFLAVHPPGRDPAKRNFSLSLWKAPWGSTDGGPAAYLVSRLSISNSHKSPWHWSRTSPAQFLGCDRTSTDQKESQGPSTQYRPLCSPIFSNLWCSAHRLW